ncbi:hypothetical protein [Aeromicrobium sp.]|uniref:hypothetical protein n=1 Tax=Aeromicrobium sp. TaxID=1871063 RepID=UPI003518E8A0
MTDAQWLEILVRMVAGEASEEPTEGVLAVRLDEESEELTRFRVRKHGHRWRLDDESGRPWSIQGDQVGYLFHHDEVDDSVPQQVGRGFGAMHAPFDAVLARPRPVDWLIAGDWRHGPADLAAPLRRTTYLGREAWDVRLVVPEGVGEVQYVVDGTDGRLLACEGSYELSFRWEELAVVDPHPPELFAWDGPYGTGPGGVDCVDPAEDVAAVVARNREATATLVADLGLDALSVTSAGTAEAYVAGDGVVSLHWNASAWLSVLRAPLEAEDDEDAGGGDEGPPTRGTVVTGWTDDRWRWTVQVGDDLQDPERERLVAELKARTRALSTTSDP